MSLNQPLLLSSMLNLTRSKSAHVRLLKSAANHSDTPASSDPWTTQRFTVVQRTVFILSLVSDSRLETR